MAHPGGSGTAAHAEPQRRADRGGRAVLICAFPRAAAVELPKGDVIIGRDWLAERGIADPEVSTSHLRVSSAGGARAVRDMGSRNGTWIDGRRVVAGEAAALPDGAVVRIGNSVLLARDGFAGPLGPDSPLGEMAGPFGLRQLRGQLKGAVGARAATVLIRGETGTGKELAALVVAQAFARSARFAAVNVAGLAAGVFESQLFGHVAGAFSDARQASKGIVKSHDGGAVFLDEIGDLALDLQPKLLRMLDNREVLPVGAAHSVPVDVLFIAATNRALEDMVSRGSFRRDLLARLAMATLSLPPLRARTEDIYAVAARIAEREGHCLDPATCEVEAVERLLLDPWPANVRGLAAALARVRALDPLPGLRRWAVDEALGGDRAGAAVSGDPAERAEPAGKKATPGLTAEQARAALAECGGSESGAARKLGVSRSRLRRFLGKR